MTDHPSPAGAAPAPAQVDIGERLSRSLVQSHERAVDEPPYRRLRIFTSDPAQSRVEGRTAVAYVPFEPLSIVETDETGRAPSVCGSLFEVCMVDADDRALDPPRLDDTHQLLQDGYAPSESNPRFLAQMVYAVASQVHAAFRRALGREPGWSFGAGQIALRIHA